MHIAIRPASGFEAAAEQLRRELEASGFRSTPEATLALELDASGLTLLRDTPHPPLRLHLDFTTGRQGYRLARSAQQREGLIRALGPLPRGALIADASAGLGRDTLLLSARGYRVMAWERHPVVYQLLADALQRAARDPALVDTIGRIRLLAGPYGPPSAGERPAAGIFDPMFPERTKRAAVKKDMQLLQALMPGHPADADAEHTLAQLRAGVERRVVVKRPLQAPALGSDPPDGSLHGKSVRFDIYHARTAADPEVPPESPGRETIPRPESADRR
ncbi:MAG: class I SAM-dependent methyltransferase [Pseudomonadota bacterium]